MSFWRRRDPASTGDFAAAVEQQTAAAAQRLLHPAPAEPAAAERPAADGDDGAPAPPGTTLEGVLVHGEEPTEAFLEEFAEQQSAPQVDDAELARQALAAPGADGDPDTPE